MSHADGALTQCSRSNTQLNCSYTYVTRTHAGGAALLCAVAHDRGAAGGAAASAAHQVRFRHLCWFVQDVMHTP